MSYRGIQGKNLCVSRTVLDVPTSTGESNPNTTFDRLGYYRSQEFPLREDNSLLSSVPPSGIEPLTSRFSVERSCRTELQGQMCSHCHSTILFHKQQTIIIEYSLWAVNPGRPESTEGGTTPFAHVSCQTVRSLRGTTCDSEELHKRRIRDSNPW